MRKNDEIASARPRPLALSPALPARDGAALRAPSSSDSSRTSRCSRAALARLAHAPTESVIAPVSSNTTPNPYIQETTQPQDKVTIIRRKRPRTKRRPAETPPCIGVEPIWRGVRSAAGTQQRAPARSRPEPPARNPRATARVRLRASSHPTSPSPTREHSLPRPGPRILPRIHTRKRAARAPERPRPHPHAPQADIETLDFPADRPMALSSCTQISLYPIPISRRRGTTDRQSLTPPPSVTPGGVQIP
ncbi:predicted GPI-anchored protein 58 [Penaeus chinensis]|uniref:predicted GPI-anchored protein 58 n=1 Tax=Penaeus chinensis TaxID=139456 RepID=UPI001FB825FD|nr:predicted GPI-anchored protein 58 [Penaeus chinensis]